MRALVLTVGAVKNWDRLYTVRRHKHPTFLSAAIARGLFHDDHMWDRTIKESLSVIRSRRKAIR